MARRRLPHVVCYDICCPKRLGRVHRFLKKRGLPLQYSVFLVPMTSVERDALIRELWVLIHDQYDDVRIYPLPKKPEWCTIGKPLLADGLQLHGVELPPQAHEKSA